LLKIRDEPMVYVPCEEGVFLGYKRFYVSVNIEVAILRVNIELQAQKPKIRFVLLSLLSRYRL
jgi:hypothetical protein